jgi:MFS family permease
MIISCLAIILSSPGGGVDGAVNCRVIHNEVRGRYISLTGMAGGIAGLLIGFYVTWVTKSFNMRMALLLSTLPSIIALLGACYLLMKVKELPDLTTMAPPKRESPFKDLGRIIGMKEFRIMMPANLMRGLGDGAAAFAYWIALDRLSLTPEYAGYVTILASAAPFLAYAILWLCMDRYGAVVVIPASDLLLVVGLMGTVMTHSPKLFLAAFLLRAVMSGVEASAIPMAHYEVVPKEVMGAFSSIRLLLLNLTAAGSGTAVGLLLNKFSPVAVFAGCAVLKLAAGALFCYGLIALRNHRNASKA